MIELVVVMLILATLAGLVAYSLRGAVDRYQMNRAIETIELFDAQARRQACRSRGSLEARIDRGRNLLSIESSRRRSQATFRLPRQVEIAEIRMGRTSVAGGPFGLNINRHGQSDSYAVHLRRGNAERWLIVLGTSGQIVTLNDQGEADAILSL
jgi:type II secretory pathway pseudopilin PulG